MVQDGEGVGVDAPGAWEESDSSGGGEGRNSELVEEDEGLNNM